MKLAKWMTGSAVALLLAGSVAADEYSDYQAEFLNAAAAEEAAENDHTGQADFLDLAGQAASGAVTLDDAPDKWRNKLKVKSTKRSALHDRLMEIEGRLGELDKWWVAANAEKVAHAFVDTLHARHELSEPGLHVLDAATYLDHAEEDLSNLVEPDRDGDGILDGQDRCPDDPEDRDGFEDSDGCPDPDNDGDGILDHQDACPNTPETRNGFLDQDGCPDTPPPPVYFDSDSSKLDADAREALAMVADIMDKYPTIDFRIDGHCDSRNSDDYNVRLGRRRSVSVRDHLVNQHGIDAKRFGIATFGESQPAADNSTREGRALNRRVEFTPIP